jgi:PTS system nitrogen regulatory IIA component
MQAPINQLVQLQELIIARAQQEAGSPGSQLADLDKSIASLLAQLPPDVERLFTRLLQRGPLAIVPAINGVCTGCGMKLPTALKHQVHAADKIYSCPSCARILFHSEGGARNMRKAAKRREAPQVGIERFSSEVLMVPDLAGTDRDSVLAELCNKLKNEGFVDNAEKLLEDAIKREVIISTAVDNGIAFPHVRCVEGGALTLTLGISREGVKFDPNGKGKTHIFFFVVIPTAASAFYLKLLSGLSQTFQKEENREKLLAADTPAALWKALIKATRAAIP